MAKLTEAGGLKELPMSQASPCAGCHGEVHEVEFMFLMPKTADDEHCCICSDCIDVAAEMLKEFRASRRTGHRPGSA